MKEYKKAMELYNKTTEINPTHKMVYNEIGIIYSRLKKYNKSIQSYIKALEINANNNIAYTNLFELQLTQNQLFDKKLEKRHIELFQNKKKIFIDYEMLKILQDITHNKKVNLELWKQKYRSVEMDWNFDMLHEWVDGVQDKEIRTRLMKALKVFEGHS